MEKRPIGYQIYSAREQAEKDLEGVLRTLKGMGYDGVEFAGFYGHSAQDVKSMLERTGLTAISSHVPLIQIEEDMFGVLSYHRTIGCKYIAVPYLSDTQRPGAPGFAHSMSVIYRFGLLAKAAGITLLYHNHDFEFAAELSGLCGLDFLYAAVPEDILKTELDLCWVKYAGLDPAAYVRKYAGRCPVIHLKDYVGVKQGDVSPYALIGIDEKEHKPAPAFEFRPIGCGCQDVPSLLESGIESGAEWFIVEQDLSPDNDPLADAKKSIDTLIRLGLHG